jgi:hypothetical protein
MGLLSWSYVHIQEHFPNDEVLQQIDDYLQKVYAYVIDSLRNRQANYILVRDLCRICVRYGKEEFVKEAIKELINWLYASKWLSNDWMHVWIALIVLVRERGSDAAMTWMLNYSKWRMDRIKPEHYSPDVLMYLNNAYDSLKARRDGDDDGYNTPLM